MKKYKVVDSDTLVKLSECFANVEEIQGFMKHLDELAEEHAFYTQLMRRTTADQASNILMKQVCMVAFFCREHMELIHDLIANLRFKEVTEEEMKDINEG